MDDLIFDILVIMFKSILEIVRAIHNRIVRYRLIGYRHHRPEEVHSLLKVDLGLSRVDLR